MCTAHSDLLLQLGPGTNCVTAEDQKHVGLRKHKRTGSLKDHVRRRQRAERKHSVEERNHGLKSLVTPLGVTT